MWRWLENHRYWVFYYVIYLVAFVVLAAIDCPRYDRSGWADVLALSAGMALAVAAFFEIGVRLVLLIQPTIKKIRLEGRSEGHTQARRAAEEALAESDLPAEERDRILARLDAIIENSNKTGT